VFGDAAAKAQPGAEVTLSIRPECWVLRERGEAANSVRGRIGEATYLGEVAQYAFVPAVADTAGGAAARASLKVYELNPRHVGGAGENELHAVVAAEDVVVLER
jgi:iron(III) transport system ATP-binding protein